MYKKQTNQPQTVYKAVPYENNAYDDSMEYFIPPIMEFVNNQDYQQDDHENINRNEQQTEDQKNYMPTKNAFNNKREMSATVGGIFNNRGSVPKI